MRKKYFFPVFFFCLIVMSACTENKTVRSLFNGEDLDLWNTQGNVKVENGIVTRQVGILYCIRMMKECGITAEDMFKPHIKG